MGWADAKAKHGSAAPKASSWEEAKKQHGKTLSGTDRPMMPFDVGVAIESPQLVPTQNAFTDDPADVTTALGAGFMDDDQSRMDFFAQSRFPDMPEEERRERYGMFKGEVVYVDDDGKLQQEVADTATAMARGVGRYALPVAGGIAGAAAGGPMGAATVGAGAEGVRKTIANQLGEKQTVMGNAMSMGKEALFSLGGDLVGRGISKMANRKVMRDVGNYDEEATARIMGMAKEQGIELTPAEASNLGSLLNQQTRHGMGFDEAGDIIREFYEKRAKQEAGAIERFVGEPTNPAVAGLKARDISEREIGKAIDARAAVSDPLYKAVDDELISPGVRAELLQDPYIAELAEKVRNNPRYGVGKQAPNSHSTDQPIQNREDTVRFFDTIKKALDAEGQKFAEHGDNFLASRASDTSLKIRNAIDAEVPGYADARKAFEASSAPVEDLEKSIVGLIAKTKDSSWTSTDVGGLAERALGSGASPADIRRLKRIYKENGKSADFEEFTNVYLRNQWEKLKTTATGGDLGKAGQWRKAVFGGAADQRRMKAALGDERYGDLENLMEVLEASQRVKKGQSMTEPAGQAGKAEAFDAAPVASLSKGFGVGGIREWWINARVDTWRAEIANVMTNSESQSTLKQLRRLKQLSPRSEKKIRLVTQALQEGGVNLSGAALAPQPKKLPSLPQPPRSQ